MDMPKINLVQLKRVLKAEDYLIVAGIVATRGENKGRLRASKPKVTRTRVEDPADEYGYRIEKDFVEGCTAYVWRMVAFYTSPKSQHQCMPCTAEFDLPYRWGTPERKALMERLERLISTVVDTVPMGQWHGVQRWAQAFGYL